MAVSQNVTIEGVRTLQINVTWADINDRSQGVLVSLGTEAVWLDESDAEILGRALLFAEEESP